MLQSPKSAFVPAAGGSRASRQRQDREYDGQVAGEPERPGEGSELAGRLGGNVHGQPLGFVAEPRALPGFNQRDRKSAQRRAIAHAASPPLA